MFSSSLNEKKGKVWKSRKTFPHTVFQCQECFVPFPKCPSSRSVNNLCRRSWSREVKENGAKRKVRSALRQKDCATKKSIVLESWHEAEKQSAIIIDKWPYASHVRKKPRQSRQLFFRKIPGQNFFAYGRFGKKNSRYCKVVILSFLMRFPWRRRRNSLVFGGKKGTKNQSHINETVKWLGKTRCVRMSFVKRDCTSWGFYVIQYLFIDNGHRTTRKNARNQNLAVSSVNQRRVIWFSFFVHFSMLYLFYVELKGSAVSLQMQIGNKLKSNCQR